MEDHHKQPTGGVRRAIFIQNLGGNKIIGGCVLPEGWGLGGHRSPPLCSQRTEKAARVRKEKV